MSCFGNLEAQVTNRIHLEQGLLPIPQAKYCVRFFSDIQRLPSQTNIAMRHKPVEALLCPALENDIVTWKRGHLGGGRASGEEMAGAEDMTASLSSGQEFGEQCTRLKQECTGLKRVVTGLE